MTTSKLQETFEEIKRLYFPRWRFGDNWRIVAGGRDEDGYCDRDKRIIHVRHPESPTLAVLLVHEITHAVVGLRHSKRFLARLAKAQGRAHELGDEALELKLQKEIKSCKEARAISPHDIYDRIEVIVMDTGGKVTFNAVIAHLVDEFGQTPRELHWRYKRLRSVYDVACDQTAYFAPDKRPLRVCDRSYFTG